MTAFFSTISEMLKMPFALAASDHHQECSLQTHSKQHRLALPIIN